MKLVFVEWVDSHSPVDNRWRPLWEKQHPTSALRCESIGWLVQETKRAITLVSHVSGGHDKYIEPYAMGRLTIPRGCITRMRSLRRP